MILQIIQQADPFILFIRHAERNPILSDDPYEDVDLTPRGYADVAELSLRLSGRLAWTAASPVLRCRLTAAGLGRTPQDDTRLGKYGPWIADPEAAGCEFASRGAKGVVRAQVAGCTLSGIRAAKEAVPLLLSAGLDRLHQGSGVCVSHDAVLMPSMAWIFGPEAAETWLVPLGGFALIRRTDGLVALWNEQERRF